MAVLPRQHQLGRGIFRTTLLYIMNNPLAAAFVQQLITRDVLAQIQVQQLLEQQRKQQQQQSERPQQPVQLLPQQIAVLQGIQQNQALLQSQAQLPLRQPVANTQQQVLHTLGNLRQQQIQESFSFLNSDSFHCPPQHHIQPPAGALPPELRDCSSRPSSIGSQPVRRLSTQAHNSEDSPIVYSRNKSQSDRTQESSGDLRRVVTASRLSHPKRPPSASSAGTVCSTPSYSRTPSPSSSVGSAGTAATQMNSYSSKGMKRQYDEYYEPWEEDPSPAKRSRGNDGNHAGDFSYRNSQKQVNNVRERYQNNKDVKHPRPINDVRVPPTNVPLTADQKITNHIWKHFMDKQQTQEAYQKKMRLREALYTVTKGIFPYCGLYMVGSSMSGFGSTYSDLDMCLMLSHKAIDQKREATDILALLLKALKKCTFIKQMELIRARVPILKFRDKIANVECDLNVNNAVGIRNTHLLGAYSRMDWRVRPLVLFTKHWASFHDINDARKMTISSYSLSMMVIHYLQCGCDPQVLPSLHKLEPEKYNSDRDVRTLSLAELLPQFQSSNNESLGELFLGFLKYYAQKFDFTKDVISIRLGAKIPKQVVARQSFQGPATQWKFICIEEPFDMSNMSRSVYDEYTFMRILQVFRVSYRRLASTRNIMALFDHPF